MSLANTPRINTSQPDTPLSGLPGQSVVQQEHAKRYSDAQMLNIPIFKAISEFETTLSRLNQSISRFKPNVKCASDLVRTSDHITENLDELQKLQELKQQQLMIEQEESRPLTENMKTILLGLVECKSALAKLPELSNSELQALNGRDNKAKPQDSIERKLSWLDNDEKVHSHIQVGSLLEYAMKLAKFSKVSPLSQFQDPRNFVWPADDMLRRGNLAMASMMKEHELIKTKEAPEEKAEEEKSDQQVDESEDELMENVHDMSHKTKASEKPTNVMADLDFDSDED